MRTPSRVSFSSVAGPTPHSAVTGSGWRKANSSPGRTSTTPLPSRTPSGRATGLAASEASLARNLVGATPTLQVSPVRAFTSVRMRLAMATPSPSRRRAPVTSRNASSSARGSIIGVTERNTSCTSALTSA